MSGRISYVVNGRRVDPNGAPVGEPKAVKPKGKAEDKTEGKPGEAPEAAGKTEDA